MCEPEGSPWRAARAPGSARIAAGRGDHLRNVHRAQHRAGEAHSTAGVGIWGRRCMPRGSVLPGAEAFADTLAVGNGMTIALSFVSGTLEIRGLAQDASVPAGIAWDE